MIGHMEQVPFSAAWLARWRADVMAVVTPMVATFERAHGYPPGTNDVRPPTEDELRAVDELKRETSYFEELSTLYRSIGEVALPDVGNGFFLHSARAVLDRIAEEGPVFLPLADDFQGMVIASDGGGRLYVADWGGALHRSRTASTDDGTFDRVADDLPAFLTQVRSYVLRWATTGEPDVAV